MLPLARPTIAVLAVFSFITYWNSFLWPLVIVNDVEAHGTIPLGLQQFFGQQGTEWNLVMAASVISMLPTVILLILLQKHLVKGIVTSGLGGRCPPLLKGTLAMTITAPAEPQTATDAAGSRLVHPRPLRHVRPLGPLRAAGPARVGEEPRADHRRGLPALLRPLRPGPVRPARLGRGGRDGAGMKYVVLTTKHHEGFCLWDSALTDYKATNTPVRPRPGAPIRRRRSGPRG